MKDDGGVVVKTNGLFVNLGLTGAKKETFQKTKQTMAWVCYIAM